MKKTREWIRKSKKRQIKKKDCGIVDWMMIVNHFFKELPQWINEMKDPRNPSYTTYTQANLIFMGLLKNACSVESMRQLEETFNEEECIHTLRILAGDKFLDEIPHCNTLNYYLEKLSPSCLSGLRKKMVTSFKKLSEIVGVDSVGWRYDPIFINSDYSVEWHIAEFEKMAEMLSGYTKTCVISFIDIYKKVKSNFPEIGEVVRADRLKLGREFIQIGVRNGMTIRPCAEGNELEPYGADCAGCMTVSTFETALHSHLDVPKRKTNQRNGQCACLLGGSMPGDVIHDAVQKSWIDGQMRFDFE